MNRIIFSCIFLVFVCSCRGDLEEERVRNNLFLSQAKQDITYFKDPRTGLCFAGIWLTFPSGVLANVPCTKEVEDQIKLQAGIPPVCEPEKK